MSAEQYLAVKKNKIILGKVGEEAQVLFEGENMEDCAPTYASQYMVLANIKGEMCVFQSPYIQNIQTFKPEVTYKVK